MHDKNFSVIHTRLKTRLNTPVQQHCRAFENVSVQGSRVPQTARRYCAAEVGYQVGLNYDEPRKYGERPLQRK